MKNRLLLVGCLLATVAARQEVVAQPSAANSNVIMYIGDGFGLAPKTAARMAMGQGSTGKRFDTDAGFQVLALDKLKLRSWLFCSPVRLTKASRSSSRISSSVTSREAPPTPPQSTVASLVEMSASWALA